MNCFVTDIYVFNLKGAAMFAVFQPYNDEFDWLNEIWLSNQIKCLITISGIDNSSLNIFRNLNFLPIGQYFTFHPIRPIRRKNSERTKLRWVEHLQVMFTVIFCKYTTQIMHFIEIFIINIVLCTSAWNMSKNALDIYWFSYMYISMQNGRGGVYATMSFLKRYNSFLTGHYIFYVKA